MTGIVRPPKRCWPRCGRSPRMLPRPGPRGKPLARHREDPIQQTSAAFYPKEWRPPGIGCRATVFVGQREIAKNVKSPPALTHRLASHAGPKEHGQETRRYPDDIVSASDFRADTALSADRAPGPGADAGFEGAVPRAGDRGAQPARQPGRRALHAAAD